jgi:hypothetical protein
MKRRKKNIPLFCITLVYILSRVLLISPDAIEKKSKRLIYFQMQIASAVNESKHRIAFSIQIKKRLPAFESSDTRTGFIFFNPITTDLHHCCYTGIRVMASPGEPDDHFLS